MKRWIKRVLRICLSSERSDAIKGALRAQKGFNLIEIMVVITIMGMLMGLVGVKVLSVLADAKVDNTRNQIKAIENMLVMFKLDNGRFPTTTEGLQALISAPPGVKKAGKQYLNSDTVPLDGWDNDFLYFCPGSRGNHEYEIISYGGDGREGGEGTDADINSWDTPKR